jgi:hypothetical protein
VAREDIQRILRWQQILGSRMVVFPDVTLAKDLVQDKVQAQRLVIRPDATISAYGEYEDKCVRACKSELVQALEIAPDKAYTVSRLSITEAESMRNRVRRYSRDY